jgi:hypothetical protein
MAVFFSGLLLGILLGWLTIWSYLYPAVGRLLGRIFAVVTLSIGLGMLVWGITGAAMNHQIGRLEIGAIQVREVPEALAWGAGFLLSGIVALVLSFFGAARRPGLQKEQEKLPPA